MNARIVDRLAPLLRPQTLVFLAVLAAVTLGIAVLVRVRATYKADLRATLYLQRLESPGLTRLARAFTWLGNSLTIVVATVVIGGFWLFRDLAGAAVVLAASLLSLPINAAIKNMVDRERPGENDAGVRTHGGPRWSYSYPSGHSMGAAAFYGTLAALIYMSFPEHPIKWIAISALGILPVLIGLSRVYLGAHWLSDIVGGWAGGVLFVLGLAAIYRPEAIPG